MDMDENSVFKKILPSGRKLMWYFLVLIVLIMASLSSAIIETKEPDEILVVQSLNDGKLTWYTGTESWVWQWFGNVTHYKNRGIYSFDAWEPPVDAKSKGRCLNGIEVRFNDGGHGTICGSIQYEMPTDIPHLNMIHTKYKGQENVHMNLIKNITGKSIYMAGPLMSSRESYAEKRNSLLSNIEDQIQNGIYKTTQREDHTKDPITGNDKTVTVTEIVKDKDGHPLREQESVLSPFGIKAYNFTIIRLPYDDAVEGQIKDQQNITMGVQTSIADAKKAEQAALTAVEQGKANAATAKWKQETIKAQAVTEAEQKRDVAKLDKDAAEYYKQEKILRGEGDAAYKQKVMAADGALTQKLATYEKVMGRFAEEFGKQKWVSEIQMGYTGNTNGVNSAQTMIDLLTIKSSRDLNLDLGVTGHETKAVASKPAPIKAKPAPVPTVIKPKS